MFFGSVKLEEKRREGKLVLSFFYFWVVSLVWAALSVRRN